MLWALVQFAIKRCHMSCLFMPFVPSILGLFSFLPVHVALYFKYVFWLCWVLVWHVNSSSWHVGSRTLTRASAQAACIESVESLPLGPPPNPHCREVPVLLSLDWFFPLLLQWICQSLRHHFLPQHSSDIIWPVVLEHNLWRNLSWVPRGFGKTTFRVTVFGVCARDTSFLEVSQHLSNADILSDDSPLLWPKVSTFV